MAYFTPEETAIPDSILNRLRLMARTRWNTKMSGKSETNIIAAMA